MRFRIFAMAAVAAIIALAPAACPAKTKKIHDDQKEKQWLSMENGPWYINCVIIYKGLKQHNI